MVVRSRWRQHGGGSMAVYLRTMFIYVDTWRRCMLLWGNESGIKPRQEDASEHPPEHTKPCIRCEHHVRT